MPEPSQGAVETIEVPICLDCGQTSTVSWCVKGCREPDPGSPTGSTARRCEYVTFVREDTDLRAKVLEEITYEKRLKAECDKRGLPCDFATLMRHLENNHAATLGAVQYSNATLREKLLKVRQGRDAELGEARGYFKAAESLFLMGPSRELFVKYGLDSFLEQFYAGVRALNSIFEEDDDE